MRDSLGGVLLGLGVAAHSHRVARAHTAEQALADAPQQLVSERVPEALVDLLEAVETHEERGDAAVFGKFGDRVLDRVSEQLPAR